jgi:flagellar biosynthetic protein FliR
VIKTFTYSLRTFPPGRFTLTPDLARAVIALSSTIFVVALKLALPVIAVLLTTELALAVVGRLATQLHLGTSATSVKMLLALLILVSVLRVVPPLYEGFAGQLFEFIRSVFWGSKALPGAILHG